MIKRKSLRERAISLFGGSDTDWKESRSYDLSGSGSWSDDPQLATDTYDARTVNPPPPSYALRSQVRAGASYGSQRTRSLPGSSGNRGARHIPTAMELDYLAYGGPPPPSIFPPSPHAISSLRSTERENRPMPTTYRSSFNATSDNVWGLLDEIAPVAKRVLLYGPPGTGKSYLARTAGVDEFTVVHPAPIHEDLPAAELRGHFIPTETGGLRWMDGPVIAAWRDGGRLVLDEIDKLSADGMSFLLAALDDEATARIELGTTNEILVPNPNLTIWATMNGEPRDLPDALLDRFVVRVHITAPHPAAIAALPEDLRGPATAMAVAKDPVRRVGLRAFMEFARLRDAGVHEDKAGYLVFGERWPDVQESRNLSKARDLR